jgi:biopolymer transport protein ExbD
MATNVRATRPMSSDINITPLIDVLLVLLVIFMVTVEIRKALQMQLAQEQGASTVIEKPIVLELPDGGGYTLNRVPVRAAVLGARLRAVYAGRKESVLFVKSGGRRAYRELVEAIDVARGAGVEVIAFAPNDP